MPNLSILILHPKFYLGRFVLRCTTTQTFPYAMTPKPFLNSNGLIVWPSKKRDGQTNKTSNFSPPPPGRHNSESNHTCHDERRGPYHFCTCLTFTYSFVARWRWKFWEKCTPEHSSQNIQRHAPMCGWVHSITYESLKRNQPIKSVIELPTNPENFVRIAQGIRLYGGLYSRIS